MKTFLEWLLSFFRSKEEKKIVSKIENLEDKLEEIEDESNSLDDNIDYINKQ